MPPDRAPDGADDTARPPDYGFRRMTRADLPLFRDWLGHPHMAGWWGDADTEIALVEEEIDGGATDMRIVEYHGTPFAFVQDYEVHAYEMPQYADLPPGARAMDTFLGSPAYLGQGHAGRYLGLRARQLLAAGAPLVAVDPEPANARAVAAYTRAGFTALALRDSEDGTPVQVMTIS